MAAVDMTSIHFYQPQPSPRPSLQPPRLGNAGGKRTAILQRDWWDKPFKTNREIEPPLQRKLAGDVRVGDGENSETAGNNRGGGDRDTNNEGDLCLPSIESFGNHHNLSSEADKNTPLLLEKIDQALSDDEFLDIDAWTASLASDQFHLQGGIAQQPVKQSPSSRMSNPMLPTEDGPMAAMATPEIWDSHKRKADTVGLDEGGRVGIHERSPRVLHNTGVNDRIDKSVIKPTFEPSDGPNKNSDIMPTRTPSKLPSKQVWAFSGLGGLNSKREAQDERSEDSIVIDDIDEDRTDTDDHDLPPLKKHRGPEKATLQPVFKVPPGLELYYNQALQDHKYIASSNRSSEVGGSQDNPFILSEIDTADTQLNTPSSTKEPKTHHCSDPNATAEPFDRLCSLSITSFEDQERRTVHANDHNRRASATVGSDSAIAIRPFASEQPQGQGGAAEVEEQEWEVTEILDKRETRSGTEYRVRWKSTWLPRSELGNARRLLREYEAKGRAQHGPKRGRPARKDKVW